MVRRPGEFRLQAKNVFLTYSQCTLSKEDLLQHLLSLVRPTWCVVSSERHQDGSPHLHAVFGCTRKLDIARQDYFDHQGFHPSIEGARSVLSAITYVKKDGDFIEHGAVPVSKRKWSDALGATSRDEASEILQEVSPRDWILSHDRIQSFLEKHFSQEREAYVPRYTDFPGARANQELMAWEQQRLSVSFTPHLLGRQT